MSDDGVRREADAGPCAVIVAEFVFGVERCGRAALYTVPWDGERWRVCTEHMRLHRPNPTDVSAGCPPTAHQWTPRKARIPQTQKETRTT